MKHRCRYSTHSCQQAGKLAASMVTGFKFSYIHCLPTNQTELPGLRLLKERREKEYKCYEDATLLRYWDKLLKRLALAG